jgi:RimJ/RimL family protein N-acetyltransferase
MKKTVLPTREPLVGRFVRLSLLGEVDLKELYPLLAEREVYASGYVMHRRPVSLEDGRDLARERFLRQQGQADGNGAGRTAYAVRLAVCSELGEADTLVGTSALMEANLHHESIHLGSTLYGRRWWGTRVNPEVKLLLLKHCFEECVTRRDMRREDGTFRDSVVFSILKSEWPEVKTGLQARLDAPTPST